MKPWAFLFAVLWASTVQAAQIRVSPVIVTLDGRENVQVMRMENEADMPVRVQVRAFAWSQDHGQDNLVETDELLLNPSQFALQPRQRQLSRLGVMAPHGDVERSYRLFVDEVPDASAARPGQVQALLRLSIPVFLAPTKPVTRLEWHVVPGAAGRMAVVVVNRGNVHARFSRFSLSLGQQVIGKVDRLLYILPGSAMRVEVPVAAAVPLGAMVGVTVLAEGDEQKVTVPIEAGPLGVGQGGQ
jgi:fimbrial chaperone protein